MYNIRSSCLSLIMVVLVLLSAGSGLRAAPALPFVGNVELQPLAAQVRRVIETAEMIGSPIDPQRVSAIEKVIQAGKPCESLGRPGPGPVDPARLAGVSREGTQ